VIAEEPGLLASCAVWLGNFFTTFRGKVVKQLFQILGAIIGAIIKDILPQNRNRFASTRNKIFQHCAISNG
jgi:hypothetical protein